MTNGLMHVFEINVSYALPPPYLNGITIERANCIGLVLASDSLSVLSERSKQS